MQFIGGTIYGKTLNELKAIKWFYISLKEKKNNKDKLLTEFKRKWLKDLINYNS